MWDMDLSVLNVLTTTALLLCVASCTPQPVAEQPLDVQLFQSWELQTGDAVAGYRVTGGLGDISIALRVIQSMPLTQGGCSPINLVV